MLAHLGVVGRALERDVERDLEAVLGRLRDQVGESLRACRARAGWRCGRPPRRRWPTGCRHRRARRPARCSCPCAARGRSDGSAGSTARRSPARRRTGSALRRRLKRAVPAGLGRGRAREQLVPAAEARALAVGDQRQLERERGLQAAVGMSAATRASASSSASAFSVSASCLRSGRRVAQLRGPVGQRLAIAAARAPGCFVDQHRADLRRDADVVGVDAALQLVAPRLEVIDPGGHRVDDSARARRAGTRRATRRCPAPPSPLRRSARRRRCASAASRAGRRGRR